MTASRHLDPDRPDGCRIPRPACLTSCGGGRGSASQRTLAGQLATDCRLSSLTEKQRARESKQLHPHADNLPPGQEQGYTLAGKRQVLFSGDAKPGRASFPWRRHDLRMRHPQNGRRPPFPS